MLDFLGAIRLPSDAFKREGTAVVTDIVFLRKRGPNTSPQHIDPDWLGTSPMPIDGVEVPVNKYFQTHPEMVLGTWSRHDTLYGGEGFSITGSGDLKDKLKEAIQKLPEFAPQEPSTTPENQKVSFTSPPSLSDVWEGSFFVGENRTICQSICGESVVVRYGGTTLTSFGTRTGKRMAAL